MKDKISKEQVKSDLKKVSSEVDGNLTCEVYKKRGRYGYKTAIRRFGSWNKAKKAAGLDSSQFQTFPRNPEKISVDEIVEDVERVSREVDGLLSTTEYIEKGRFDIKTVQRNIGWNKAKRKAGLDTVEFPHSSSSRNPMKKDEVRKKASKTIQSLYDSGEHGVLSESNRLKTSRQARRMWDEEVLCSDVFPSGEDHHAWVENSEYYYGSDWSEIAEEVRRRDNFRCKRCGKRSADSNGRSLEVHHIKPFRSFDDVENANSKDNLVSLCTSCHTKMERLPVRIDLR